MENLDQLLTQKELRNLGRIHARVESHLAKHNRTLQEEAALVEQKRSHLSSNERDYVVLAARAESLQSKETETTNTQNNA